MGRKAEAGDGKGVAFVYDYAHASSAFEACLNVWNAAAAVKGEETRPDAFLEKHGLSKELRFEDGIARKSVTVDWWDKLYS